MKLKIENLTDSFLLRNNKLKGIVVILSGMGD